MRLPVRREARASSFSGSAASAPSAWPPAAPRSEPPPPRLGRHQSHDRPHDRDQGSERQTAPPAAATGRRGALQLQILRKLGEVAGLVVERVGHRGESSERGDAARPLPTGYLRAPRRAPREAPPLCREPPRRASRAAPRARPRPTAGPSGTPCCDQVVAVDLEPDPSPLGDVAVEPLGAQRPGERQLDPAFARGPARPPRTDAAGFAAASSTRFADSAAQRRRKHRVGARDDARHGSAAVSSPTAADQLQGVGLQLDAGPSRPSSSNPRRASRLRGELAELGLHPVARDRRRGRRAGSSSAVCRLQREPVAGRVSGGPQGTGGVVHERAGVQDSQLARAAGPRGPRGDRSARDRRPAAPPSR